MLSPFWTNDFSMIKAITGAVRMDNPTGKIKAILRGGTFHRVQVLVNPDSSYIEHCGLNYRVTQQKDVRGRVICLWDR